jgi:predicted Holliday junction resolvase-like endonuclease
MTSLEAMIGVISLVIIIIVWQTFKASVEKGKAIIYILKKQAEALTRENEKLKSDFTKMLSEGIKEYREKDAAMFRKQIEEALIAHTKASFEKWKSEYTVAMRQDAINRSRSVILGKVSEHIVPFKTDFPFNPKDVRFIGSPIDMVVFDGADEEVEVNVFFLEIKTGNSGLNKRQKLIRDAVFAKRVEWLEVKVGEEGEISS